MKCELCKNTVRRLIGLPIAQKNGSLLTMACIKCAIESPAFCVAHNAIHLGFADSSTACRFCIEQDVFRFRNEEKSIASSLFAILPFEEARKLREAAVNAAAKTGTTTEASLVRFIATRAHRTKRSVEEVLEETLKEKTARLLLET